MTNAGHEGADEARVVSYHPTNVEENMSLEGNELLLVRVCGSFRKGHVSLRIAGFGAFGNLGSGDRLLESLAGELGEDALWDKTGREEDTGDGAEALRADKTCRGQENEIFNQVREGIGKVNSDTATKRVADKSEAIIASPGELARGKNEENLCGVEPRVVGEIAYTVAEASAKEVEEHDTATTLYKGVGEVHEGDAACGDAMHEENLGTILRTPFIDADRAILRNMS
jgi:hypothetical protein